MLMRSLYGDISALVVHWCDFANTYGILKMMEHIYKVKI